MKKIIEYTSGGKTELGTVGQATLLKDDLGNELKVGDVVFFQFEDGSKMFGISIVISTKENINYILGLYSLFDENGNKKSVDQWFSDADKKMYKDKKESR